MCKFGAIDITGNDKKRERKRNCSASASTVLLWAKLVSQSTRIKELKQFIGISSAMFVSTSTISGELAKKLELACQ